MIITDKHITKISQGDIKVFKLFFDAFYPSLCKFCFDFLKSTENSADVAQEAMIKFWKTRDNHTSVKQAKVYLFTIARNDCINLIKHRKVADNYKFEQTENPDFISNAYIEDEVIEILNVAVDKLPPQSKNIIQLALKGYANNQIAEELNISVNTVKTLKKSAYNTLRGLLKNRVFITVLLNTYLLG